MKRTLVFLLALAPMLIWAQTITGEKRFALSYPASQLGYPSQIVPTEDGGFAYVEFWPKSEGKSATNYYLQCFNDKYEEVWYKPVTRQGNPVLESISEVRRVGDAIAVIGTQFDPGSKRNAIKMQLFGLDGAVKGSLQTMSSYTKKEKKGYEDQILDSPNQKVLMWMGHNPGAKYKKRGAMCSVWEESGRKKWSKKLYLRPFEEKYLIKEATVDDKGNAYFLMVYESMTNTEKDTLFPPIVVRYDHRENKYTEHLLDFPGASFPESKLYLTQGGDLVFLGVKSDGSTNGFANGGKRFEQAMTWNQIVYQQFDIERELVKKNEYVMDFPQAWLDRYGKRGANFSKAEMLEHKGQLYWVLEEFYTQQHNGQEQHLYYDVAAVRIDMGTGEIEWASSFEKKQRDYKSGRLLSYVPAIAGGKLHFVYLNERGAQGKILCTSLGLDDGAVSTKTLARNDRADYLFFPARSSQISEVHLLLMGIGNPLENDYKLVQIDLTKEE